MAVTRRNGAGAGNAIRLEGLCPVEDAESLVDLLLEDPTAAVDWGDCTRMHTAVFQVLLRLRPTLVGTCGDPFVARWLMDVTSRDN